MSDNNSPIYSSIVLYLTKHDDALNRYCAGLKPIRNLMQKEVIEKKERNINAAD